MGIKAKVSEPQEVPEFEEGTYAVVVTAVEETESKFGDEVKPQIKWTFTTDTGLTVTAWTSTSYFEGSESLAPSRLYDWFNVFEIEVFVDEEGDVILPVEQAVGQRVVAYVQPTRKGWPTIKRLIRKVTDKEIATAKAAADEVMSQFEA